MEGERVVEERRCLSFSLHFTLVPARAMADLWYRPRMASPAVSAVWKRGMEGEMREVAPRAVRPRRPLT